MKNNDDEKKDILKRIIDAEDLLALKIVTAKKPIAPTELSKFEKIGKYIAIRKQIVDTVPGGELNKGANDDDI